MTKSLNWKTAIRTAKMAGAVFIRPLVLAAAATAIVAVPMTAGLAQPAVAKQSTVDALMAQVLANPRRDVDRPRDRYRHPAETLAFFQIKPGMTVVDYLPSEGWYTRILVPYLGPRGRYVAMAPDVTNLPERVRLALENQAQKFPAQASQWNLGPGAEIGGLNTPDVPADLAGQVDRVLILREMHDERRNGLLHADLLTIRKLLKPNGMVGIEDHRAFENAAYADTDGSKGYLRESDVVGLMRAYGFDLVAKSDINANPKDTKDYPQGVWMLPPLLQGTTAEMRPKMLAIGESDRMTLLFRKRE